MNLAVLRSRERNLGRGLGALAGLAFLVVGVPAVLLGLSGALLDSPNPLGGMTAPWTWSGTEINDALTRALDNQTVISTISRVGLALAWLALAVIVSSVAFEVRSLRVHGIHMPRLHGLGWSQAIARRLAAGLLALSTVLPSHIASAAPLAPRAVATLPVTATPLNQSASPAVPTSAPNGRWTTYTVARGDSIYGIAGRLTDGDRGRTREIAQQILDRNLGHVMNDGQRFTTPGVIQIGWILDVPADGDTTVAAPSTVDATPVTEETYTVQRGDSYWEIADHHLEIVLGHEPTPREVLDETHSLMDANVDRLGNRTPNSMIYSGDVLILPNPNGYHPAVDAPPETPVAPETSTPSPPPPSAPLPPPTAPPITTVGTPPPTAPAALAPSTPAARPVTSIDVDTADAQETATPNPWAELVIGSLFATGLATTVTRLRRRRLARRTPGHRLVNTTDAAATTETVLRAESRPDRIDALHRLLGAFAGHTRLEGNRPLVRAVQMTDTGIELLWTEAQPSPAKAWTTTDGGWSWRTPWPTEQPDRAHGRPILPTLVPIGVRADGAELLLDLETAGSLSIEGEPELVTAFTNQLVLALAASPLADNIDLITIDLAVPGAEHLERIRTSTIETATAWLTTRTTETGAALTKSKAPTTFAARLLGRSNDEWEPIVIVAPTADDETASRLAGASLPGGGSVAILRNVVAAAERIILHSEHRAEWVRLGLAFTPLLVPNEAAVDVAELLANVEDAAEVEVVLNDSPIQAGDEVMPDGPDKGSAPRSYDVLVRALGEVEVEGVDEHLTDAEVELLALLATVRPDGPINLDRLATLLAHDEWRTPKPRSIQARISHLRRKLGNGTDGNPLVPDSRASTGGQSRYLISPRVVTDIDLLDHAYRLADNLPSSEAIVVLRQAFELVRGKPYTARSGYTWAYDEHAAARAEQVVGDVAARLIDLHGEAGDAAGIQSVIQRARRGLDGPIAELPHRLVERIWATRMVDPELLESTEDYQRVLAAAVDEADPDGEYELR
jgi:LysM domain